MSSEHLDDRVLQDRLDGLLSPAEAREVEAHLAACPACAADMAELEGLREALRALPRTATAPAPRTPLSGRPTNVAADATRRAGRAARVAGLAAAFLVGAVAGGVVMGRSGGAAADGAADPLRKATEVQRTGSAYAGAIADLRTLGREPRARDAWMQGREAALSVLYAATIAYASLDVAEEATEPILAAIREARAELPREGAAGPPRGGF